MEALEQRVVGHVLENLEVRGPSLLRTADPPIYSIQGQRVTALRRVGKRIAFGFDNDLWLVFHLMIAGRLHWSQKKKTADGRRTLAAFDFDNGTLTLTEAGTRKRASLHLVRGEAGLAALDPGGVDVFAVSLDQFSAVLTSANHTLKRALTDPRLFRRDFFPRPTLARPADAAHEARRDQETLRSHKANADAMDRESSQRVRHKVS
jgi:formamidopyrimidine-DNA glycosylase